MTYPITVEHDRRIYRYLVQHKPIDERTEHFLVIGRNKTIIVESNRPLFRNRGLKHRRYDLRIIDATSKVAGFERKVCEAISGIILSRLGG